MCEKVCVFFVCIIHMSGGSAQRVNGLRTKNECENLIGSVNVSTAYAQYWLLGVSPGIFVSCNIIRNVCGEAYLHIFRMCFRRLVLVCSGCVCKGMIRFCFILWGYIYEGYVYDIVKWYNQTFGSHSNLNVVFCIHFFIWITVV